MHWQSSAVYLHDKPIQKYITDYLKACYCYSLSKNPPSLCIQARRTTQRYVYWRLDNTFCTAWRGPFYSFLIKVDFLWKLLLSIRVSFAKTSSQEEWRFRNTTTIKSNGYGNQSVHEKPSMDYLNHNLWTSFCRRHSFSTTFILRNMRQNPDFKCKSLRKDYSSKTLRGIWNIRTLVNKRNPFVLMAWYLIHWSIKNIFKNEMSRLFKSQLI